MSDDFSTELNSGSAEAHESNPEALKRHDFGIASEIGIREALKEEIGVEVRPHIELGTCSIDELAAGKDDTS